MFRDGTIEERDTHQLKISIKEVVEGTKKKKKNRASGLRYVTGLNMNTHRRIAQTGSHGIAIAQHRDDQSWIGSD